MGSCTRAVKIYSVQAAALTSASRASSLRARRERRWHMAARASDLGRLAYSGVVVAGAEFAHGYDGGALLRHHELLRHLLERLRDEGLLPLV
jgi:hypothetical protein